MIFSDERKYYYCRRNVKASRSHLLFCLSERDASLDRGLEGAVLENEIAFHDHKIREARAVWVSDLRELVNIVGVDFVWVCFLIWGFVLMAQGFL